MLATDALVQKSDTTTTQLAALIPKLWAGEIEINLRKREVFQQSVLMNTDLLVPNSGDTVYIPSLPDLPQANALTEDVDIVDTQLTAATSVPFVPTEYGMGVQMTRKALDRIKYDGIAQVLDRLSYSMSLRIEGAIAALWNAVVPSVGGSLVQQFPAGFANLAAITSAAVFTDDCILGGVQQLEQTNNIPFEDDLWRLYISPKQKRNLFQDANVRNDIRFAVPEKLIKGEIGVLHNCRIIVSNYVTQNAANGNGVVTYNAMLLAPRWAAIAWKRRPELVIDPTLYDYGRRRRMAITSDYDCELLHSERAVVITTA